MTEGLRTSKNRAGASAPTGLPGPLLRDITPYPFDRPQGSRGLASCCALRGILFLLGQQVQYLLGTCCVSGCECLCSMRHSCCFHGALILYPVPLVLPFRDVWGCAHSLTSARDTAIWPSILRAHGLPALGSLCLVGWVSWFPRQLVVGAGARWT